MAWLLVTGLPYQTLAVSLLGQNTVTVQHKVLDFFKDHEGLQSSAAKSEMFKDMGILWVDGFLTER